MNICVIGGSGFVGSRLIPEIISLGKIINFDKRQSPFYPELTRIIDIRNKELLIENLKDFDIIIHLAAEHKDNITPTSLYYDVNVTGTKNILEAMSLNGIKNIIFTSSVAVYGLNKSNPNELSIPEPFNHYGKSKLKAEKLIEKWFSEENNRSAVIIRPTVIFGERNRGNVYNLLKQISSGWFVKVGSGNNKKSMAYVGNIVAFIKNRSQLNGPNLVLYNYIDKPDLSVKELINIVAEVMDKSLPNIRIPYFLGYLGGKFFDILSLLTNKEFNLSAIRIRKLCATTQFDATKIKSTGFKAPYELKDALKKTINYEFISENKDNVIFETE